MPQEVEIRFKIDKDKKNKILEEFDGWEEIWQEDLYYRADHDEKGVIRIRKQGGVTELSYKFFTDGKEGWGEIETPITYEENSFIDILKKIGYELDVKINKKRHTTRIKGGDIEINVDKIEGLGCFCELEIMEGTRKELNKIAEKLGIEENDVINEGYVQLVKKIK